MEKVPASRKDDTPHWPGGRRANEKIVISCFSPWRGTEPILKFLDAVRRRSDALKRGRMTLYRAVEDYWSEKQCKQARGLDSVVLEAGVKEGLVHDLESYINIETHKYYAERGVPWRRGYLFHGPPGTLKTSLTIALAGYLKLNVYIIDLADPFIDDFRLERLFERLPQRSVVPLEDIDSAGIGRENMKPPAVETGSSIKEENLFRGVTLSGILHVLDGVHAVEGRIVIMTSNTPESLDEALVRQGRIDRKVYFGLASQDVAARLFVHILGGTDDKAGLCQLKANDSFIEKLAPHTASHVADRKHSPAAIQGYLLDRRGDPLRAVSEAAAHFEALLAAEAAKSNVPAEPVCDSSVTKNATNL